MLLNCVLNSFRNYNYLSNNFKTLNCNRASKIDLITISH